MYLHNEFTHCVSRGWRLGTEVNVLKFESAMMCTKNVVSTNPRIMDVVFVISLTHQHFIDLTRKLLSDFSVGIVVVCSVIPVQAARILMKRQEC